jgi:hypothetical protein
MPKVRPTVLACVWEKEGTTNRPLPKNSPLCSPLSPLSARCFQQASTSCEPNDLPPELEAALLQAANGGGGSSSSSENGRGRYSSVAAAAAALMHRHAAPAAAAAAAAAAEAAAAAAATTTTAVVATTTPLLELVWTVSTPRPLAQMYIQGFEKLPLMPPPARAVQIL